ncbi:MAG: serine dehydratase, partial [Actinomycetia bacterium]|nr:serine dehydratase [Actinomycetes bacterium]
MPDLVASIFNDVIGPVMRGPSSSHSAAAVRIGRLTHDLLGGVPDQVDIEYDTLGSLATTHESQGTDMGLCGGMLGWEADDPRLPESPSELARRGTPVTITKSELGDAHPNTYRLDVRRGDVRHQLVALSTGGGIVEVVEIDGHGVRLFGDHVTTLIFVDGGADEVVAGIERLGDTDSWTVSGDLVVVLSQAPLDVEAIGASPGVVSVHTLRAVLPVLTRPGLEVPFDHACEMGGDLEAALLSDWAIAYECERGGIDVDEVLLQAHHILDIMRGAVETGVAGTEYADRILGWQSGRFASMVESGSLLDGGLLNQMIVYVTALMEAKSAMEVIVAAPTAGACATFPGALLATIDAVEADDEAAARALLAGGLVGIFVTNRSSFAAEVGGCQAETGAGS